MLQQLKTGFMLLVLMTVFTGVIYPLVVTGLAQIFFPWQANGSLIEKQGKQTGSLLIGQSFSNPNYFWGRPSETKPVPYNGASSSGSNSGPSNPDFLTTVKQRINQLKSFPTTDNLLTPVDLVTASGSGLDPDISPYAATYQVPRIAKERGISENALQTLITQHIKNRSLLLLGEPRINVLQLNIALDNLHGK